MRSSTCMHYFLKYCVNNAATQTLGGANICMGNFYLPFYFNRSTIMNKISLIFNCIRIIRQVTMMAYTFFPLSITYYVYSNTFIGE